MCVRWNDNILMVVKIVRIVMKLVRLAMDRAILIVLLVINKILEHLNLGLENVYVKKDFLKI